MDRRDRLDLVAVRHYQVARVGHVVTCLWPYDDATSAEVLGRAAVIDGVPCRITGVCGPVRRGREVGLRLAPPSGD